MESSKEKTGKNSVLAQGYVLIWVVLIFACISIVSVVLFTDAQTSNATSKYQHNYQQAFYTAKSACLATSDYILDNVHNESIMNHLFSNQGTGSSGDNIGSYVVNVSRITSARIKVESTAIYNNVSATVTAYLITLPRPSGIVPTENAIFVNGNASSGIGQMQVYNSDMYIKGDLNISYGTVINGSVVVDGNVNVSGGSLSTKSIFSFGNVTIGAGGTIGSITCEGDLIMTGYGICQNNAYVQGSLNMTGSGTINGDAVVQNNVTFSGGENKIGGMLSYGGVASVGWGNLSTFAPNNTHTGSYTAIDDSSYITQELPIVAVPTEAKMPSLYQSVTMTDNRISSSGTITSSIITAINAKSDQTVTIDCSAGDIYLRVKDLAFNINRGAKIIINTDAAKKYNVYLFLDGTASLSISSNVYMGLANSKENPAPHLYIIGNNNNVTMTNNSTMNALIYIPNGRFSAVGDCYKTYSIYKLIGCAIAKTVQIENDVKFYYAETDTNNTPLDVFKATSTTDTAWFLESWGLN